MAMRPAQKPAFASVVASNLPAEKAVIGALLKSEEAYWKISDVLRQDHFTDPLHQQIFGVVRDICEEGKRLSLVLLLSRLPPDHNGVMMDLIIHNFIRNAEDVTTPLDFAESVAETANMRRIEATAHAMLQAVKKPEKPAIDVAGEAELAILDIMHVSAPKRPIKQGEIAKTVIQSAFRAKGGEFVAGYSTGLTALDEVLGLVMPGDLGFIIASQGDGKSALAAKMATHIAQTGPVLFIQMEMSDEQQVARDIAQLADISVQEINEGAFDFAQADKLKDAEVALQKPELYILDIDGITVRQIGAHCLAMKRTVGLAAVFIDQLDKIKSDTRHFNKFDRAEEITRDLKNLFKRLKVPGIVLAQRTRSSQRKDDPVPGLLDTNFPSIEGDADWVLGLWREFNWLMKNRPSMKDPHEHTEWQVKLDKVADRGDIIGLKRRRGGLIQRPLRWNGRLTEFKDF